MSVSFTGPTPTNYPTNSRTVRDATKVVTIALPASATSVNTNAIDLEVATPYPTTEIINARVGVSAAAAGNNVNVTAVLQHTSANTDGTANSAAWTNIPTLGTSTVVVTGAIAAQTFDYKLPPGCLEFIRCQFIGPTNVGNVSTSTGTLELLF
jgi:hypothetical protein